MTQPLLRLAGVNTYYGESHILHDLSFQLMPGEVVAILGRNGVGKTTTLQSILGAPSPRTGEIEFRGEPISRQRTSKIVAQGIGWVPQGHRIFPTLTVLENLELAAARARPGEWSLSRVLNCFPRLKARIKAAGDALSGGEQQMLAIARALIQNPDLFLMDEPSEGLSPLIVQEVGALVGELNRLGASVLIVEQNLAFALSVAHRVLIMNKGTIVWSGSPSELDGDLSLKHRFLGMGLAEPALEPGAGDLRAAAIHPGATA